MGFFDKIKDIVSDNDEDDFDDFYDVMLQCSNKIYIGMVAWLLKTYFTYFIFKWQLLELQESWVVFLLLQTWMSFII